MKVTHVSRTGLGLGLAALVLSASIVPAHADPAPGTFGTLAGLGSDTTQDVMNGLAASVGGNVLASYDASGATTTVVTKAGSAALPRANGSSAGRDLLRVAIGQVESAAIPVSGAPSPTVTTADVANLVQFARSSSGAGSAADAEGVLTYIPFGVDAVTYAVAPGSAIPANLTKAELTSIFKGEITKVAVTAGGVSRLLVGAEAPAAGETVVNITTFIPQAGSGTRSYWLGQMGITESDIAAGTYANLRAADYAGAGVQEHKGAALVSGTDEQDRGAIVPFSIAQWVAQGNGKSTDHRAGALLGGVAGQVATTGAAGSYALNPAYNAYTRQVYNIVPSALADDPTSQIAKTFVGEGSLVCKDAATIAAYGFGLLTGSTKCGDTSVRAYKPSTSTTTLSVPATATVGTAVSAKVDVTSFGNAGGTVRLVDGATVLASTKVARGASSATLAWTPTANGTRAVSAVFVPTLPGVGASRSASSTVAVTAVPTTPAATSSTSVLVPAKATVGTKASVRVSVVSRAATAGTVTLFAGTKPLGTAKLAGSSATFAVTPGATSTALRATFSPADASVVRASSSATVTLKAAKAKATVKVKAPKKVKVGARAQVTVSVSAKGVKPAGKIVVKSGKRTLATKTLPRGKSSVKVTLPRLAAGKHKLTVSYTGSKTVNAAKAKTVTLRSAR